MKHAILGAGAIGGLVGTVLSSLGEDVAVVVRAEKLASYPSKLTLERPSGSLSAPAKAVSSLTKAVDVLWIATKTYQLQTALESVKVTPGCIVPLLNGVDHVAVLRAQYGQDRVVPGTIAVEAGASGTGTIYPTLSSRSPQPRCQRRAALRSRHYTLGQTWIQLPIYRERADIALGQALLSGSVRAGDFGVGNERWRDLGGCCFETKIDCRGFRGFRSGERWRRGD